MSKRGIARYFTFVIMTVLLLLQAYNFFFVHPKVITLINLLLLAAIYYSMWKQLWSRWFQ